MHTETLALIISSLAVVQTTVITLSRVANDKWKKLREADRAALTKAEADLLAAEKANAILEVQLRYCEGELKQGSASEAKP